MIHSSRHLNVSGPFGLHTVSPPIAEHDFLRCARLLRERTGIIIGAHRRDVVSRIIEANTQQLGLISPCAYLDALEHQPDAKMWQAFVNAFTVNHTAFFRERHHFQRLTEFVRHRRKPVSIWCCAASTGEEPYSIAITLAEAGHGKETGAYVWATDIDTAALHKAEEGVYTRDRVAPVGEEYLKRYFQRGVGDRVGMVRVKPELAAMVQFQALNLLDPVWPRRSSDHRFDVIFCRNTMIYFDKATQKQLLERFVPVLKSDGLLFVGHSENFTYISKAFRLCGQTVYGLAQS